VIGSDPRTDLAVISPGIDPATRARDLTDDAARRIRESRERQIKLSIVIVNHVVKYRYEVTRVKRCMRPTPVASRNCARRQSTGAQTA
jgi:hypothetical protein